MIFIFGWTRKLIAYELPNFTSHIWTLDKVFFRWNLNKKTLLNQSVIDLNGQFTEDVNCDYELTLTKDITP